MYIFIVNDVHFEFVEGSLSFDLIALRYVSQMNIQQSTNLYSINYIMNNAEYCLAQHILCVYYIK